MCLVIDWKRNKLKPERKGSRTCFKVLTFNSYTNRLITPYRSGQVRAGTIKSNRERVQLSIEERCDERVEYGIHVFTNRKAAGEFIKGEKSMVVVPVTVFMKDLVAFGTKAQAVFMKIRYKKSDLKAAHDRAYKKWLRLPANNR